MPFGKLTWGSCQYDTAADFYLHYIEIPSPKLKHALSKNGIKYSFSKVRSFDEIKEIAREFFQENYFENEFWKDESPDMKKKFNRVKDLNGLFDFMRNWSFDLWTAAGYISDWTFTNLKIDCPDNSETYGPSLNQIVQAGNDRTGLQCLLLTVHAGVFENAFKGFDT